MMGLLRTSTMGKIHQPPPPLLSDSFLFFPLGSPDLARLLAIINVHAEGGWGARKMMENVRFIDSF